jgi:hypothetical protein
MIVLPHHYRHLTPPVTQPNSMFLRAIPCSAGKRCGISVPAAGLI